MISSSITLLVLIVASLGSVVVAVRKLLLGPRSPAEFRKQFRAAWGWAGVFAGMMTWQLVTVPGLNPRMITLAASAGAIILVGFLLTTYPMCWLAWRLYDRSKTDPDFAEDAAGNPVADDSTDDPTVRRRETWRDVIRAERKRRR